MATRKKLAGKPASLRAAKPTAAMNLKTKVKTSAGPPLRLPPGDKPAT